MLGTPSAAHATRARSDQDRNGSRLGVVAGSDRGSACRGERDPRLEHAELQSGVHRQRRVDAEPRRRRLSARLKPVPDTPPKALIVHAIAGRSRLRIEERRREVQVWKGCDRCCGGSVSSRSGRRSVAFSALPSCENRLRNGAAGSGASALGADWVWAFSRGAPPGSTRAAPTKTHSTPSNDSREQSDECSTSTLPVTALARTSRTPAIALSERRTRSMRSASCRKAGTA
jgi:hypothetical protein